MFVRVAQVYAVVALLALPSAQIAFARTCSRNYTIKKGDFCDKISQEQNVSTHQLAAINPKLLKQGCTNLRAGKIICLGFIGDDCLTTHVVKAGENCEEIASANRLNMTILRKNNPQLGRSGTCHVDVGQVLCTSKAVQPPPIHSSGTPTQKLKSTPKFSGNSGTPTYTRRLGSTSTSFSGNSGTPSTHTGESKTTTTRLARPFQGSEFHHDGHPSTSSTSESSTSSSPPKVSSLVLPVPPTSTSESSTSSSPSNVSTPLPPTPTSTSESSAITSPPEVSTTTVTVTTPSPSPTSSSDTDIIIPTVGT